MIKKVAQQVFGGPVRNVAVEFISPNQTFEVTVQMRTGIVHGPHTELYTCLEDERNTGNTHRLTERLVAWRDSGFASSDT